jgi:hypothetical protein
MIFKFLSSLTRAKTAPLCQRTRPTTTFSSLPSATHIYSQQPLTLTLWHAGKAPPVKKYVSKGTQTTNPNIPKLATLPKREATTQTLHPPLQQNQQTQTDSLELKPLMKRTL